MTDSKTAIPMYGKVQITQYFMDLDSLKVIHADYTAALSSQGQDFVGFVTNTLQMVLEKAPDIYLRYGPYWWAVKRILNAHDAALGDTLVQELADAYCIRNEDGSVDEGMTIVAATAFREYYDAHYFQGNAEYFLGQEGQGKYVLFDPDMRAMAA